MILFDLDGVIIDTEINYKKAFLTIGKQMNIPLNEEEYDLYIGKPNEQFYGMLRNRCNDDQLVDTYIKTSFHLFHHLPLCFKPGFPEFLFWAKEVFFKIGLCTATMRETVIYLFKKLGFDSAIFDVIVTRDDVIHCKPDPEIYNKAAEKAGVNKDLIYVLEDSSVGVEAAFRAGLKVIMLPDLIRPEVRVRKMPGKIYTSIDQVKQYLTECAAIA